MTHGFCSSLIKKLGLTSLLMGIVVTGCNKQKLIPNTKVLDTPEHREIIEVVEKYRQAMERIDAAAILALTHPTYQDNSGTPEGSDDIDYARLKEVLTKRFKRTSKIHYRLEYQSIQTKGTEAAVDVYIDATFVYQDFQTNPRWRRLTDYNRFRLYRDGSSWRFVGGL